MVEAVPASAPCPCQSGQNFGDCCHPLLSGTTHALTAVALMRSRYTAYVLENSSYLRETWHPSTCPTVLNFTPGLRWLGLKVLAVSEGGEHDEAGTVQFRARYKLPNGQGQAMLETSQFYRLGGRWLYLGHILVASQ